MKRLGKTTSCKFFYIGITVVQWQHQLQQVLSKFRLQALCQDSILSSYDHTMTSDVMAYSMPIPRNSQGCIVAEHSTIYVRIAATPPIERYPPRGKLELRHHLRARMAPLLCDRAIWWGGDKGIGQHLINSDNLQLYTTGGAEFLHGRTPSRGVCVCVCVEVAAVSVSDLDGSTADLLCICLPF